MPVLSEAKDLTVCRLLTGWDSLEKRTGGSPVIDFNLPGFVDPDCATRYTSRYAVLEELKELQQDSEIKAYPRLLQKMRAQEVYLRNLMGEHWDFQSYIENTQGFTPRLFSEADLAAQRGRIEEALSPWNLRFDSALKDKFSEIQEEIPHEKVGDFYQAIFDRSARALTSIIGPIPQFNFKTEVVDIDAYWRNWVDGSQKDYLLRFNLRRVVRFDKSFCTLFAFHEVMSHMVQAAIICDKINEGQLPRCMGLTTVHGPEQFQLEGLAQTLTYFLVTDDSTEPMMQAAREIDVHERMLQYNNAHIMINSGASIEDCAQYLSSHLPYKHAHELVHSLSTKANNPQMRSYEHVYGASVIAFRDIAFKADATQKQQFLKRIYHDWLPANELASFSRQLLLARSAAIDLQQPKP